MYKDSYLRLIYLKRGEIIPYSFQSNKFCYAFDKEEWLPREMWPPTFYQFNRPDTYENFRYLKEFLIDELEAIVFIYTIGNGIFTALKNK